MAETVIRTPDQRLRVFVSSTLRELREERNAAREAILHLRLTPVLFEQGARPYPPQALYRAYLDQSQVFIGIYWQQYGQIAPDMDVSGLEDEYRLSADKPRLIYIREPAPDRETRLSQLLDQIKHESSASYKYFRSEAELQTLIEEDLAQLLSERFRPLPATAISQTRAAAIPVPRSRFIGREREVKALHDLLGREDARLVTLTGLSGIGKTRLALRVANQVQERFTDGASVVFLGSVRSPAMVLPAVLQALGLQESSDRTPIAILKDYLREREMLLLLDNFEYVIAAAPLVGDLLENCPRLKIFVTSVEALQISGEHRFEVPPLTVPASPQASTRTVGESEAVRLFVDRAQEVQRGFRLDDTTAPVVAEIVGRLEGLPLAIELAAARLRLLPPAALLQRLTSRVGTLTGGPRDLPARQQTLRSTIDWSYNLLEEPDKVLLARLSVFAGGWTLDAAEAVGTPEKEDTLEAIASLIDKSLARTAGFAGGEPRFSMLEIVREYALERLTDRGEIERRRDLHAEYFLALAKKGAPEVIAGLQEQLLERFTAESGNFRAAMRWLLDRRAPGRAAQLGWALWNCWWLRNRFREAVSWMEEILAVPEALSNDDRAVAEMVLGAAAAFALGDLKRGVPHFRQAYALYGDLGDRLGIANAKAFLGRAIGLAGDPAQGEHLLKEALATFREVKQPWGYGITTTAWGLTQVLLTQGRGGEAVPVLEEIVAWARGVGEKMALALTLTYLGMARLDENDPTAAWSPLIEALELSRGLDHWENTRTALQRDTLASMILTWTLEALAAMAVATAHHKNGALLFGAAEGVRLSAGGTMWAYNRSTHETTERELRAALGADGFQTKFSEGTRLSAGDTVALAKALR
jgi:predicted ATPase